MGVPTAECTTHDMSNVEQPLLCHVRPIQFVYASLLGPKAVISRGEDTATAGGDVHFLRRS